MAEALKTTTEDWIGNIPESWDVERMRYSLKEINVKNSPVKTEQILSLVKDKGVMLYEEKGDVGNKAKEDITGYKVAFPDTLIVNSMNILIGSVGISKYKGCVSPVYYVFKDNEKSDLRYINYIFNTREFQRELRKYANGILEIRLRVSATDIFNRKIPVPAKDEQVKIADFLDEKCAEIDKLSEDIQKQIDILNDYKKSVIIRVVTKGLDSDTETKESGVYYNPSINKDWKTTKIGYICDKLWQKFDPSDTPLICSNSGDIIIRGEDKIGKMVSEDHAMQGIRKGDIAIHGMDTWHGAIALSNMDGKITRVVHVCNSKTCDNRFIVYYLQNLAYIGVYKLISFGIRENTSDFRSWDKVKDIYISVPTTIDEQKAIADFLDNFKKKVDEIISSKQTLIDKLLEYKKSIIYEYVTGKKRVA